ncbi:hypothetical protein [Spartinivicinus poritis]|uniref:Uncharacterized protein n=1 Tax=Spartinivicinus poritis TaxID=2994640 RepID=A0ABT5UD29_9GAMM|nr:hypothetical protein [Spartinivicinus sp. A2-2]MDE1464283.1 hypothetical protein [Spartinivicinus sp. A2-2]
MRDLNIPENRPITHTTVNDIEKRQLYTEIHRLIRQEIKENVSQPLAELIALQKIINEKEQPIFSDEEFQVAQSSFQTATAQLQAHIAQGDLDESAAYELMSHYDKMTPDQRYDFSLQYADAVNKGLVNLPKHIKEYQ